jgi:uncharacterized membrane protein YedE/YeeE
MEDWPTSVLAAIAGGLGGIVLGLAARLGRFCTLSAIEDAIFGNDLRRLRMWGLALAVAIACVGVLSITGQVDFSKSFYNTLPLNPAAWIVGGVMFGFGMALCGTCGYGTLARVGGGDLRALFGFLIMGISAYMAIAGPTAHLRVLVLAPFALQDGVAFRTLGGLLGDNQSAQLVVSLVVAALLALWSLGSNTFRKSFRHMFWGLMVGLAVVSGWLATAQLGLDPFDPIPLASHTFSVPLGQTIIYFMTMSSSTLTFGIGGTIGVAIGAFIGALIRHEFRWEGADDAREMRRHIVGAFLMGTGGVYAGGCTIGQGISAASLLAISAPVVMLSIWCGAWLGLNYLMEGSAWASLRSWLDR